MASNYPAGLDTFDTIDADDRMSDQVGGRRHRDMHNGVNDAVEAVQAELGVDPAGSAATVAARLDGIEDGTRLGVDSVTADKIAANAVGSSELADGAVTSAKIADGTIVDADINASAAIAATKIAGTALVASTVDAKGDILTGTAADTVGRLAVGSNGAVLVADSAQTAGVRWTTARRLEGTGAPEGVVAAPPGSTFLQTDSTTDVKGWIRWIKATGTGNTGWVAGPEADTGWRNVSSILENSWTGALYLRRVGSVVSMDGQLNTPAPYNSAISSSIPTGFRAGGLKPDLYHFPCIMWNGAQEGAVQGAAWASQGVLSIARSTAALRTSGAQFRFTGSCLTNSGWPSSLPGSAA